MSKIFGFSFGKQSGTTLSHNRKVKSKAVTRGFAKHLQPGIDIGQDPPKTGGGTNTETQYSIWLDSQYGQTILMDGVDQSSTWPSGFVYPVLLSAGSIDPQNLITLDVSDPYPWSITLYADSTNFIAGDQTSDGGYVYLWPPDVQGGTP